MKAAKALTALILTLVTVTLGSEVANNLDSGLIETLILGVLVAAGVYGTPNREDPTPWDRLVAHELKKDIEEVKKSRHHNP